MENMFSQLYNTGLKVVESSHLKDGEIIKMADCIYIKNVYPIFFLDKKGDLMKNVDDAIRYAISKIDRLINNRLTK